MRPASALCVVHSRDEQAPENGGTPSSCQPASQGSHHRAGSDDHCHNVLHATEAARAHGALDRSPLPAGGRTGRDGCALASMPGRDASPGRPGVQAGRPHRGPRRRLAQHRQQALAGAPVSGVHAALGSGSAPPSVPGRTSSRPGGPCALPMAHVAVHTWCCPLWSTCPTWAR